MRNKNKLFFILFLTFSFPIFANVSTEIRFPVSEHGYQLLKDYFLDSKFSSREDYYIDLYKDNKFILNELYPIKLRIKFKQIDSAKISASQIINQDAYNFKNIIPIKITTTQNDEWKISKGDSEKLYELLQKYQNAVIQNKVHNIKSTIIKISQNICKSLQNTFLKNLCKETDAFFVIKKINQKERLKKMMYFDNKKFDVLLGVTSQINSDNKLEKRYEFEAESIHNDHFEVKESIPLISHDIWQQLALYQLTAIDFEENITDSELLFLNFLAHVFNK